MLCFLPKSEYTSEYINGKVIDYLTKRPIPGAIITSNNEIIKTDNNGMFVVKASTDKIGIRAYGYARAEQVIASHQTQAPIEIELKPFIPRALYLSYYGIGDRSLRGSALRLMEETSINSLVIDVKGDRGVITYKSSIPLASEIGAQKLVIVKDIRSLLQSLRQRNIYTIARIVVFKDNILATARPELAVKTQDGRIWRDREDLAWVDPSRKEVWDYNIDIAVEAAQSGFDEIQFDYIRFPDKNGLKFAIQSTEENRTKSISGFLKEARRRLAPYNVFLAADIFGYVCWNLDDTQIGQKLGDIVSHVDYLSPMLYPSGFQFGIPNYRNPVANSYKIVYLSLKKAQERTNISPVRFRPWLQAFRDYAFDRRVFTGKEINDQITSAEEFGAGGWMLWNPRNAYSSDGLRKESTFVRVAYKRK
ncbi:MAG TPA: putative glycoside hydrolase [Thermodesulfovibrionales bacterium]|nr:putative glycoside hydrolase [Thermodesulfovibrionales bacterium]